jgi:hypothetical protein
VNRNKAGNKEVVGERHANREPKAVCEENGACLPRRNRSVCRDAAVTCFLAGRCVTKETVLGGSYGTTGWLDG